MSFRGPPPAASPLCNASRLEPGVTSDFATTGLLAALAELPLAALGFSAVHFGGGGLAGLPQPNNPTSANTLNPWLSNRLCCLIIDSAFRVRNGLILIGDCEASQRTCQLLSKIIFYFDPKIRNFTEKSHGLPGLQSNLDCRDQSYAVQLLLPDAEATPPLSTIVGGVDDAIGIPHAN